LDFKLTKEEQLIQKAAKEFAEKMLDPIAEEIDRTNEVPPEIIKGLGELGMFGIPLPGEYGGGDAGHLSYAMALEQLSKSCPGICMIISVNTIGLSVINAFGTSEQKKKYLPEGIAGQKILSFAFTEPGTGSDPKQLSTTVTKEGNYYLLNGTKRFITNAGYEGPMVVIAKEADTGKASAFILDKFCEGYSLSEPWDKIGMHGGLLYDVYFDNVRIPEENMLGKSGDGFWILKIAMVYGKLGLAALFLGLSLAAYEEGLSYAKQKTHRGEPIASKFQQVQLAIADMAIKYDASKWYTYHFAYAVDHYKDPMLLLKEAAFTKLFVVETAVDIAQISMGVHGSYGLMKDYRIARIWNDVIFGPQVEGTVNVLKVLGAGVILNS
jgi:alkylation response protein AidB-like acyl-CoA dehydrogenase